jgi:hypothetical protein
MFCAPGLVLDGTEGVDSYFHVLRARTRFRRYRRRRFSFSCFVLPDSFSAVPRSSGPVFMFSVPGLIFNGTEAVGFHFHVLSARTRFPRTEGVGSRFHVLRDRTHFRRYRGRQLPFSNFALPNSFSAVPRASAPVFMFCAPGLVLDGIEGVDSCFQVSRARTHFLQYRGRLIMFS